MMSPQMARIVPLAIGSRISTWSCQRGASTSSQSCGASGARHRAAVERDHRRRAVHRPVEDRRARRRPGPTDAAQLGRYGASSESATPRSKIVVGPPNQTSACGLTRSKRSRSRISWLPMSSQRTSMSGCRRSNAVLEQRELVAAVRRVDDDRRAARRRPHATRREETQRQGEARADGRPSRHGCSRRRLQRQQVREQPVGAGHARRQLPEEAQAGVHVGPLPDRGHQQSALQRRLARIVHLEQRPVLRVPGAGEVEPALLHPALPVGGADRVRRAARRDSTGSTMRTGAVSSVTRSCESGRSPGFGMVALPDRKDPSDWPPSVIGNGAKPPPKNSYCWYCTIRRPPARAYSSRRALNSSSAGSVS